MKKFLALTLASLMLLTLAACGKKTDSGSDSGSGSGSGGDSGTFTPSKTVTWTCTSSAGGGSDIFSRKSARL